MLKDTIVRNYGYYQKDPNPNAYPYNVEPGSYYFKIDDGEWDCYSDGASIVVRRRGEVIHEFPLLLGPLALVHIPIK